MPDANDASEQIKLLTDLSASDSTIESLRQQNELALLQAQAQQVIDNQPTKAELKAQSEAQKAQETAFNSGTSVLNEAYAKLGLTQDQGYVSQLSGELSATLAYQLGQQLDREQTRNPEGSPQADALASALTQLDQYSNDFMAQNGGSRDYKELLVNEPERIKDLASEDSFFDGVKKAAATAVAGIPGLAGIGVSSLAASEDTLLGRAGQALGGLASDVQGRAPTDIGSSAANQQFQDILARADAGELSTGDAIRQGVALLGDGDFAGDLLANTVGAAAGGGVLRAGAGAVARGLGAGAARQAGTGVLGQAGQAAPAIGVGLGSGVDENLTPGQARLLLGTGVASAGLAGGVGALGGQVAETALGNLARNTPVVGRFAGTNAAQATDDLTRVGLGGQLRSIPGGAARTAAGEAPQEFIEGAGESLGESAQPIRDPQGNVVRAERGALETLADPEARSRAVTAGAVSAPIGGALGGTIGSVGAPLQVQAQNRVNAQEQAQQDAAQAQLQAAQQAEAQQQADLTQATGDIESQQVLTPQLTGDASGLEVPGQAQAAEVIAARDAQVENIRQTQLTQEIAPTPLAPEQLATSTRAQRLAASQPTQQPVTLIDYLNDTLANPTGFDALIDQGPEAVENTFRALYRNEVTQGDIDPQAEDAFIDNLSTIDFENTPLADIRTQIGQAAVVAQDQITLPAPAPAPDPTPPADSAPIDITPDPIAEVDPIVDEVTPTAQPDPIVADADTTGINPAALFNNTEDGAELSGEGRLQGEALRSAQGSEFQSLSAGDRQAILGSKKGAQARKDIDQVLKLAPPYTPAETTKFQDAVTYLKGEIARKKPETPAEGEIASATTFTPNPADPQTATPEFAQFFEGSKVVDTSGTPQVLYHGTPFGESISDAGNVFNTETLGTFFSTDIEIARGYANRQTSINASPEVVPAYVSIRNPLVIEANGSEFLDLSSQGIGEAIQILQDQATKLDIGRVKSDGSREIFTGDLKRLLEGTDYDGAIINNVDDIGGIQKEFVAFEPTQIKSATDNSGSFDPTNSNFRQSRTSSPTSTIEFKNFFGDSKAVDSDSNPLELFHGSETTFDSFDIDSNDVNGRAQGDGFYFTTSRNTAETYRGSKGQLVNAYIKAETPFVQDLEGGQTTRLTEDQIKKAKRAVFSLPSDFGQSSPRETVEAILDLDSDEQTKVYKAMGFDSVNVKVRDDFSTTREIIEDHWVVFESTQIKSATDNSGAFDSSNPNFRESRTSSPARNVRQTQGLVGPARVPLSTGLLPESDGSARQVQSFDVAGVQGVVDTITTKWKKVPKIKIVSTTEGLPTNVRPTNGVLLAGVTDGDTAYLVADQLTSPENIESVLNEELFHKGLMKSLGGNYDPQLARVFKKRGGVQGLLQLGTRYKIPANFTSLYQDVIAKAQSGDRAAQLELTDEILARVAQSPNLPSGILADIKTVVAKIKKYLKQFLPDSWFDNVTDADLLLMIREANAAGREDTGTSTQVRQSRSTPGDMFFNTPDGTLNRFNIPTSEFRDASDPKLADAVSLYRDTAKQRLTEAPRTLEGYKKATANLVNRSNFYGGVVKRFSDANDDSRRQEGEFRQMSDEVVNDIFNAVKRLDLPPSIQRLLAPTEGDSIRARQAKEKITAIHSTIQRAASRAFDLSTRSDRLDVGNGESFFDRVRALQDTIGSLANHLGITVEQAKSTLSKYSIATHAQERNDEMWLRNPPLEGTVIKGTHEDLLNTMYDAGTDVEYQQARTALSEFVQTHATSPRAEFRGAGMTDAEAQFVIESVNSVPAQKVIFESADAALKQVIAATNEINRVSGSLSNSQQASFDRLGWQNYVPLRGKGLEVDEDIQEARGPARLDEFNTAVRSAQGRESLVDNIYDNVINAGTNALMNLSHQESLDSLIFHTVATDTVEYQQAFEADGANGELYKGNVQVMDINKDGFKKIAGLNDPFTFIRYHSENNGNDVQLATVIRLDNSRGVDAVRGARSEIADLINKHLNETTVGGVSLPQITRFTASLKTYRSIPFIPFSALRELFTNGYVASSDNGFAGMQSYVDNMMRGDFNYLRDIFKYSIRFAKNDFKGIQDLISDAGDQDTLRQLDEFFAFGGPTQYLAALRETPPGSVESLTKLGDVSTFQKVAAKADEFFSYANGAFDLMSRFAYYRSLVDNGTEPSVAAARAKGIANFEQTGTWGGPLGGVFEFARPSASGATGLINATLTGKYGPETAAASFGAGAMIYLAMTLLAGQDEDDQDYMAEVNGKLLVNNIVFQYGDKPDERIQFGTGFGPMAGMLGSGMQVMRFLLGHQSLEDMANNTSSALANQFQVLPTAGISPLEKPLDFVGNTLTPSILKPWYEVERNLSGLGIPVRTPGYGGQDVSDSFGARYNSQQELYDQMTQHLSNTFGVEYNPDNVKHIMRGYGGTITQAIESVFEAYHASTADEEFILNKKQAFYPLRAFIAPSLGQTQDDFYKHANRIQALDREIKELRARQLPGDEEKADALEDSPGFAEGLAAYKEADKRLKAVNKENRPAFKLGTTPTAEARRLKQDRTNDNMLIYRDYLDQIVR